MSTQGSAQNRRAPNRANEGASENADARASSDVRTSPLNDEVRQSNATLLKKLGVIVVAMFAFGFALVPLYEKICQVTGIRDIGRADEVRNTQVDATRSIRVEFDSNLRSLPWTFKPLDTVVDVHPGEVRQVEYEIANTTDRTISGQAIPSYGPQHAGQYFKKLDCFCFARQTLRPGETRRMPVVFVVDPSSPTDLTTITLSYTFFEVEGGGEKKLTVSDSVGRSHR